jgi:hypothetical protein
MPELEEVFRISTQNVRPKPQALERQLGLQRRRLRQRKVGVYATVAALVIAGIVVGGSLWNDRAEPVPGGQGPLSEGVVPTVAQLVGTWATTLANGEPLFVLFQSDGTFGADGASGVLYGDPAGAGRYALEGGAITFVSSAAASVCVEGDDWTWEARLLENGRLRTVVTEDGTGICELGRGEVWTWVRLPG